MKRIVQVAAVAAFVGAFFSAAAVAQEQEKENPGFLGAQLEPLTDEIREDQKYEGKVGLHITGADEDTPAGKGGLKEDDVLLEIAGRKIKSVDDTWRAVYVEHNAGDAVEIKVWRGGKEKALKVTLGERPEDSGAAPEKWQKAREDFLSGKGGEEKEKSDGEKKAVKKGKKQAKKQEKKAGPGFLGVKPAEDEDDRKEELKFKDEGVLIGEVIEGSAAEKAGLKGDDIILKVDDEKVSDFSELHEIIVGKHKAGDKVNLHIWRKGEEKDVEVKLGKVPQQQKGDDEENDDKDQGKGDLQKQIQEVMQDKEIREALRSGDTDKVNELMQKKLGGKFQLQIQRGNQQQEEEKDDE